LRETQKLKRTYGILDRQFRIYIKTAEGQKGNTGDNLLVLLERRLDNVVYNLGFAQSRCQARQIITHGHVTLNGRKTDIPSALVRAGDEISIKEIEKSRKMVETNLEFTRGRELPEWLERDDATVAGKIKMLPTRDLITTPIREQLVVEFSSK
jgi:small subunit ribosomal protein S4